MFFHLSILDIFNINTSDNIFDKTIRGKSEKYGSIFYTDVSLSAARWTYQQGEVCS